MSARARLIRPTAVFALVAATSATTACSSKSATPTATPSASATTTAGQVVNAVCLKGTKLASKVVHFPNGDDTGTSEGYVNGSGTVGLVLVHQAGATLCQWEPGADKYAAKGYTAMAITLDGNDTDQEVVHAAAYLRARGATKIVLVGTSMGGSNVLVAASEAQPPVQAVVSISAPAVHATANALAAMKNLQVPVYFFAGQYDDPFNGDAKTLYDAVTEKAKTLFIVPDAQQHGIDLWPLVEDKMDQFIKDNAG